VKVLWTFRDLPDEELEAFARLPCRCMTSEVTGTRSGYTCPAHRASAELRRRDMHAEHNERVARGEFGGLGDA
jgi:hypothetical protein